MGSLRSKAETKRYQEAIAGGALERGCVLCKKELVERFRLWRIVKNDFPYDIVARMHNMLVPIRHVTEEGLTEAERRELSEIKRGYVNEHYDWMLEAAPKKKSVPGHFHLHLIVVKDFE